MTLEAGDKGGCCCQRLKAPKLYIPERLELWSVDGVVCKFGKVRNENPMALSEFGRLMVCTEAPGSISKVPSVFKAGKFSTPRFSGAFLSTGVRISILLRKEVKLFIEIELYSGVLRQPYRSKSNSLWMSLGPSIISGADALLPVM